jgi:hypothetical protein
MTCLPTLSIAALGLAFFSVDTLAATKYHVDCLDCNLPGATLRPVKINSSGAVAANDIMTGQGYVIAGGIATATPLVAGATFSTVSDINDAGHLVGIQATAASVIGGYLWRPGTIAMIAGLYGDAAHPSGINAADQVTGSSYNSSFLYDRGLTTALPPPPGHSISWGTGINISGHVVGYSYSGGVYSNPDGWRYADGTITVLSRRFVSTYGNAINDLDEIAGRVDDYPAYWNASGRLRILNTLPGFSTGVANSINIHGVVVGRVVGNNSSAYPSIAFMWDGGKVHDLNALIRGGAASGWMLNEADSVNDLGVIVGLGTLNGQSHAFIATPVTH